MNATGGTRSVLFPFAEREVGSGRDARCGKFRLTHYKQANESDHHRFWNQTLGHSAESGQTPNSIMCVTQYSADTAPE